MDKVVNKSFVDDKEVTLIAERFGTKFYIDNKDKEIIYITAYDDVVAIINPNTDWIVDIKDEYKTNKQLV